MLLATAATLGSCKDHMAEYYERPDWIKGNNYEVLEKTGRHSIFLKAIDMAGYHDLVDGKGIVTVMAPDDEAFDSYFAKHGVTCLEDMDSTEVEKLVAFHLMYYAYNADKLNNFRPEEGDDVTDEEKMVYAGMYYKHRTYSKDPNSVDWDRKGERDVTIYHHERFLPSFSENYFTTKQIDAAKNYRYFFPETEWNPTGIGFNVANAAVSKGNQITSNGFVHEIDHVLEPLNTIYDELNNDSSFSQFLSLYKQYESFTYDAELSKEYGNGEKLFLRTFSDGSGNLPQIALEWPTTDYTQLTTLSSVGYTVFAPTDNALNKFFDNYWAKGGYKDLKSVSQASVKKLLLNFVYQGKKDGNKYDGNLAFPEEIQRGDIINSYGTAINVNLEAVPEKYRILCENGLLYGCEEAAIPAMFSSITGPAYQYKKLSYYLLMFDAVEDIAASLYSDETRLISLMPDNDQILASGITYNDRDGYLMRDGKALNNNVKKSLVYGHLTDLSSCNFNVTELDTTAASGLQVFRCFSPDYLFYWYLLDGKLTNSFRFNERIYPIEQQKTDEELFVPIHELKSYTEDGEWTNGKSYSYEGRLFVGDPSESSISSFQTLCYSQRNTPDMPYYAFTNLLYMANMFTSGKSSFDFIPADETTLIMLIPTNEAVYAAISAGQLPGLTVDSEALAGGGNPLDCISIADDSCQTLLQNYLKTYFVSFSSAGVSNYPFPGWKEDTSKGMATLNSIEIVDEKGRVSYNTAKVVITEEAPGFTVRRLEDSRKISFVGDYHYLPFVFSDGCVHLINGMF